MLKKKKKKTGNMEKNDKVKSVVLKLIEDKKAISECIRNGGDILEVAKDRGIQLATPV